MRTHTGFLLGGKGNSPTVELYANPIVDTLYLELINKPDLTNTWAWRKQAISTIFNLFNENKYFFKQQVFNGVLMSPRVVDFIHSTLTFILTGKRKLSVELWSDLLEYHPTDGASVSDVTKDHFQSTFGTLMNLLEADLIAMWISQPGGLHDLVVTAHLIFGALPENWREV